MIDTFIEILKVIGVCLLAFGGLILLNIIAILQVTWNMSQEEKDNLFNYIKENGIIGHDDEFP